MDDIERAYDRWSLTYDSQQNATRDLDEMVLRHIVPDLTGLTVVECGCGTGKNSLWLAPRCAHLIGLDFSAGMLRLARVKVGASNALFMRHDIRHPWPLGLDSADVVLFNLVLEHVEDLTAVLSEAARVLKHGGAMALSEYHPSRVAEGKGPVVMEVEEPLERRIPNFLHTVSDYRLAAQEAGLELSAHAEWSETGLRLRDASPPGDGESRPQLVSLLFDKP